MKTYLSVKNFDQKVNKKGEKYGWPVARYTMPETILGYEYVTKAYSEEPIESANRIALHMMDIYPVADVGQIKKLIGLPVERKSKSKKNSRIIQRI